MEYIKINSSILEEDVISKVKMVLKNGGVIAFPTDTVYGLAGDLFSEDAVKKIYEIKGRDYSKPLPVLVCDIQSVALYVEKIPDFAYKLMEAFCPGSLTVILKRKVGLDISLKTDTLGFRIPDYPMVLGLLKEYGPLVCTSANISGGKDAVNADEVSQYFDGKIDLILDGGQTVLQRPSTIIDCTSDSPKIIRGGKITQKDIKRVIGGKRNISPLVL
ncbi:MAG: threonylcarbamoyl-AMP synthase [Candidatus Omnitrophica bacterium]|nr:threonylcarbamoyl-AMP synthase [Candidatus Omnitrophota bacterium]MBU1047624.1 threonylcarbamoyl-AMP synthase [Candidatus Omnitrophota bacterium]MBU1630681.1 threonylcarbamoyl-AMP synthase [Candidatus Omnitrophota bacterium]MBU1888986.1 threonylcarbamoyl-AMP synthase [Candidatus Omnitrophota bacterium]